MWNLVIPVKVFRDFQDGTFDVCDEDGNCFRTLKSNLVQKINNKMKAMKDAVLKVAQDLAKANNTVTTLEIKTELRRDYPYYFWDQKTVSAYMDQLAGDGLFTYTDNGTYRIYSLAGKTVTTSTATKATKTITVKAGKGTANTVSVSGGTPVSVASRKINTAKLLALAANPNFVAVTLADGKTVNRATIKGMKKSPAGYISPKVGRIASIVVGTTQYNVK